MPFSTRCNGLIEDYWPDDSADSFYIQESASLETILDEAKYRFGKDISMGDIYITAEHIHTRCLTYDLYDPSDYDDFLCIAYKRKQS